MLILIWQEIPEGCSFYLIPNDSPHRQLVLDSKDQYVNHVDTPADAQVHRLSDLIYSKDHAGWPYEKCEQSLTSIAALNVDGIVMAGFLL